MSTLTPKQQRFVQEFKIAADRFWSYVDMSGAPDGCWSWKGCRDSDGYGRFHIGTSRNATMLAHRVAFGISTGECPEAVCHSCDNPTCCNPAHLFGGTRADNNRDMLRKGRYSIVKPKGEAHGSAKLTDALVREIRDTYILGNTTQYELADRYGVCQRTINKVVRRMGWSHV